MMTNGGLIGLMSKRPETVYGHRIPAPRLTWRAPALACLWLGGPVWAALTAAEILWRLL